MKKPGIQQRTERRISAATSIAMCAAVVLVQIASTLLLTKFLHVYASIIYGVLEKPFRNYYEKADRMKGMTGENLMTLLESRLDNVVFRMGFARTRREARQIVDHKHVLVNGKCVNIPSYLIKAGDVVEIKEKNKGDNRYKLILEVTGGRLIPAWLDVDQEALKGTVKALPTREEIDVPVNEMLIVELYSK